ncbi:hypothetical protein BJ912DRAFT_639799 [Pholiota molesta]|nr:hypothetical protein BJ912DRAFT_639799 [Pholiota molesta]
MPSKKEQQRRRLLKLRRTLGEDVPLELLMPPPSSGPSATRMRDLASFRPGATPANMAFNYSQPPISVAMNPNPTPSPTLPRTQKRGAFALGMRRKKNMLAAHTSAPRPAAVLEPIRVSLDKNVSAELSPRAPSPPVILISAHPYSSTIPAPDAVSSSSDYISPSPVLSTYYRARGSGPPPSTSQRDLPSDSENRRSHWPRTPFAHAIEVEAVVAGPTYLAPPPPFAGGAGNGTTVRRSERRQGWSGEWNQPDMQDVIAKLRNI